MLSDLRYFLIAVIYFIPVLVSKFQKATTKKMSVALIVDLFQQSIDSIQDIEKKAENKMKSQSRKFDFVSNFILLLQLIMILSFTFFYRKILCVI